MFALIQFPYQVLCPRSPVLCRYMPIFSLSSSSILPLQMSTLQYRSLQRKVSVNKAALTLLLQLDAIAAL